VPRNKEKHGKNPARKSDDEHCIHNAKTISTEFLAAAIREPSIKFRPSSAVLATTVIVATIAAVFPQSQAIQSIQQPQPIREILPPSPESSSRPQSSAGPQNSKALPSFGTIMPITGGSAMEFETKKQRSNYFRSVNTIINDGLAARLEWAKVPITFTEEDFRLKSTIHNDAMVIEVNIAGWVIGKVLVDNESSTDILFLKTFEKMNLSQHMLDPPEYPLQGFGGKPIKPVGKISLPVSFGNLDNARTENLTFDVVDIYHPYLAIFGRGFMNKFDTVIRQQFLCMKMPAPKGVITVFSNQQEARNIEKGHTPGQTNVYQLKTADEKKETYEEAKRDKQKIEIAADGETKKVYLDDMPDRGVTIGAHLSAEEDRDLVQFLNKNKDVFAWLAKDLQGVDRDIIEHALETDEKIPPKKQKLRKMSEEKVKAVEDEVQRLQDAQVIREVKYPVWLANTVPVKKKNGKWRMCVDFTYLNKACKKDDFPLERVDKIVDDVANSEMLSLLDMFSGYHQIRVRKEDEEKTSFITPFGTFCFLRMPEGLKNAGCTFSRR
jgi:hypothetical protein